MYAEEYLPDDAIDYHDVSDVSIEETSSMDSEERDIKKSHELFKRLDPDYYSYKTIFKNNEGEKYLQKVQIFSTPLIGRIRNAPTGIRDDYRSGTNAEDLYFVVKDTAIFTKTATNNEPRKLFYRSPEEFERHHQIDLSQTIKENWYKKNAAAKLLVK